MASAIIPSTILQHELAAGEYLLWNGQPKSGLRLGWYDLFLIPFSFLWAGFAVFWELGVISSGAPFFFVLWGIPFLLLGAYITIGRFFVDALIRSRTQYAVTNERILIIGTFPSRSVKSLPLQGLSQITIEERRDGSGVITFGMPIPFASWYRATPWPWWGRRLSPAFDELADARAVYELIRRAQRAQ